MSKTCQTVIIQLVTHQIISNVTYVEVDSQRTPRRGARNKIKYRESSPSGILRRFYSETRRSVTAEKPRGALYYLIIIASNKPNMMTDDDSRQNCTCRREDQPKV